MRVSVFVYELIDLTVFVILWAGLWYIYDFLMHKYVGDTLDKTIYVNIGMACFGIVLLFLKNRFIQNPYL